jgi:tetratricopeptide (TPR) repeat protein
VTGYASPEGNFESNRALSDRRANSFADYLSSTHGVARDRFRVSGLGEDWNGLKEAVEKSSLADKNEIIRVINSVSSPDARDAEMKKLSGGQTCRTLLDIYYPPLRRTDYTIAYTVRAFSVEEAKGVIKTNPKLLSLNEMFLVAQTYAPASSEFKEVFDIATRLYPDEPIAILNSAAADIEGGNNRAAIDRLNRIESDPRAWNNLGVAYVRLGDTAKAKEYFQRAALRGDEDAKHNLEELGKTMEN